MVISALLQAFSKRDCCNLEYSLDWASTIYSNQKSILCLLGAHPPAQRSTPIINYGAVQNAFESSSREASPAAAPGVTGDQQGATISQPLFGGTDGAVQTYRPSLQVNASCRQETINNDMHTSSN